MIYDLVLWLGILLGFIMGVCVSTIVVLLIIRHDLKDSES